MLKEISTYNGPIAVLDFLGFKDFVENNPIEDVMNAYGHEITGAAHTSKLLNENLEFMVYSDTIAIRLVNQTEVGFLNFIKALQLIAGSFFMKALAPELKAIPLRGAVAFGDYAWHNGDITMEFYDRPPLTAKNVNFIVGQAIIEAHEHEKVQQWIGISMNEETAKLASERFPTTWQHLLVERYLIEYDIPVNYTTIKGFVVNPTIRPKFVETFKLYIEKCDKIFKNEQELFPVKLKYFNTLKLLNDIHSKDDLCPYFHELPAEERKEMIKEVDKTNYFEIIEYFENYRGEWEAAI